MTIKSVLLSEGLNPKNASNEFEVTDVPENKIDEAVIDLKPGTFLTRKGKRFGISVFGGYAVKDGGQFTYVRINLFNPRQNTSLTFSEQTLRLILSL